ncbi:hypothetical protein Afil01_11010 [Actinorhabdospora filicis]|uniref:Uncharacterized protein n=1 Tax=Actinorhabdospora filicis TaxID=1785913 RepID=A0A9W6W785_9ACTN|nr:hypothetical protein [Actinorhabdospora filicis]GLZ76294.1 hypothetical protein Afil01_11010 [Actinorhabdospora filicis]
MIKNPFARLLPVGSDAFDRWIGGTAMVLAPLLLTAGVLTRCGYGLLFDDQLAAYAEASTLLTWSYSLFALGVVALVPAVIALARRIGGGWGVWGGTLALLGLLARIFHAGADHMAFRFADAIGVPTTTEAVRESYGAFHVFATFSIAIMTGWIVLAIGAKRTGVLGWTQATGLALACALPLGVLKGATVFSLVAVLGLALALVPAGVRTWRTGPAPRPATAIRWTAVVLAATALATLLGQAG